VRRRTAQRPLPSFFFGGGLNFWVYQKFTVKRKTSILFSFAFYIPTSERFVVPAFPCPPLVAAGVHFGSGQKGSRVAMSTGRTARVQGMKHQHAHHGSLKKSHGHIELSGENLGVDVKFRLNHVNGIDERQGLWAADFNILIGWEIHNPNYSKFDMEETPQETRFFSSPTSQSLRRVSSEPNFPILPDAGDVNAGDETKRKLLEQAKRKLEAETKRKLEAETKHELVEELDVFFHELEDDRNYEKDHESTFITFKSSPMNTKLSSNSSLLSLRFSIREVPCCCSMRVPQ
jgi:hypothetical protein